MKRKKTTPKKVKLKKAPLYMVLGSVKWGRELKITVVPILRAKKDRQSWIFPSLGEIKRVQKRTLGKVDLSDFKDSSVDKKFYRGYCKMSGVDGVVRKIKAAFKSAHKVESVVVVKSKKSVVMTKGARNSKIVEKQPEPVIQKVFSAKDQADIDAVKAILKGDKSKFSVLYKRYYQQINYKFSQSLKFNKDLADDLTADLFVKVYENLSKWTPEYTFNSWITRVANNFLIDYTRKPKMNTVSLDAGVSTEKTKSDDSDNMVMQISNGDLNPAEVIMDEERTRYIKAAIDKLPERDKNVINMLYFKQMSYEEIAQNTEIELNTIKAIIFRSKAKLREYIKSDGVTLAVVTA